MTTRIAYGTTTQTGQNVADFVAEVSMVLSKGRRLKAKLDSMSWGNDWTAVESEVGGMTAGTGQALWTLIATAMQQIDSPQVAELARLDK
jgi:hypothetical protein